MAGAGLARNSWNGTRTGAALAGMFVLMLSAGAALGGVFAAGAAAAAPQAKKQEKDKDKEKEKEKEKKDEGTGGGLFTGTKAPTVGRSEERRASVSAGAKGAAPGSGEKISNTVASSSDRSRVATMEASKPGRAEMEAFLKEGKLSTSRKGGS